jgi:hypothetical protein
MSEASEQLQQRAHDEVENYKQTVNALLAFSAFVVHDGQQHRPGANFGFGRRMGTSAKNRIAPSNTVTPDLVAQKSESYGITAEVKKSLPLDQDRWHRPVKQLAKYDDELIGWWTPDETMPCADTVLLLHHSRSRPFCRFLEQLQSEDPDSVGKNTTVVEFIDSREARSYYSFRLESGSIRDEELLPRLRDGVQVPLDKVVQTFPSVRFYDSQPPVAYLLTPLWMDVFPAMVDGDHYDEGLRAFKLDASVQEVTAELQKAYGSANLSQDTRSVEFPRVAWVRDAFEKLVEFKMALPPSDGSDVYQILFKTPKKDILQRFIELDIANKLPQADTTSESGDLTQPSLFADTESDD